MVIYGNNMQQFTQPFFIVGGWPIVVHTASFYLFTSLISANVLVAALIDVHGEVRERLEAIDKARQAALAARKGQVVPEPDKTIGYIDMIHSADDADAKPCCCSPYSGPGHTQMTRASTERRLLRARCEADLERHGQAPQRELCAL